MRDHLLWIFGCQVTPLQKLLLCWMAVAPKPVDITRAANEMGVSIARVEEAAQRLRSLKLVEEDADQGLIVVGDNALKCPTNDFDRPIPVLALVTRLRRSQDPARAVKSRVQNNVLPAMRRFCRLLGSKRVASLLETFLNDPILDKSPERFFKTLSGLAPAPARGHAPSRTRP